MDTKKTGGPAYPETVEVSDFVNPPTFKQVPGMTLLDHFAGLAMRAMLTESDPNASDYPDPDYLCRDGNISAVRCANRSYAFAAAMIAERERIMNAE